MGEPTSDIAGTWTVHNLRRVVLRRVLPNQEADVIEKISPSGNAVCDTEQE
ncbi:hypothetical protein ACFY4K_35315 [Streptomyces leeuwenhoekii]|uniref:hypothetical protein n=1 Tax=Streptomyces leeuwenhoekii TaxID=1437453 RepID=UPI0036CA3C7C